MDDTDRSYNEMFQRVEDFGAERVADFSEGSLGRELFAIVSAGIADFSKHSAAQAEGASDARRGTAIKANAREALQDDVEQMSRTTRAMAYEIKGLDDKFRLPRYLNDQQLLETGRIFAVDGVPYKAAFIRYEMPADFLESLADHIADFEAASHSQNAGMEHQVSSGTAADTTRAECMNAIRRLDVLIRNKYRHDAATLAAWERARHIERPKRPKKEQQPTSPPTP